MNDDLPQDTVRGANPSTQQASRTAFEDAERDASDRIKAIGLMVLALVLFSALDALFASYCADCLGAFCRSVPFDADTVERSAAFHSTFNPQA